MTMQKYTGGNAFPWDDDHQYQGLTVLDYFAAHAASGLIAAKSKDLQDIAQAAYDIAEHMVAERAERVAIVKEEIDAKQGWP